MKFDNYQKTSSLNMESSNWYSGKGEFIRKGIVGDWVNYFTDELAMEYDKWIVEQCHNICIEDNNVLDYFCVSDCFRI
jgi:hypothetical protein